MDAPTGDHVLPRIIDVACGLLSLATARMRGLEGDVVDSPRRAIGGAQRRRSPGWSSTPSRCVSRARRRWPTASGSAGSRSRSRRRSRSGPIRSERRPAAPLPGAGQLGPRRAQPDADPAGSYATRPATWASASGVTSMLSPAGGGPDFVERRPGSATMSSSSPWARPVATDAQSYSPASSRSRPTWHASRRVRRVGSAATSECTDVSVPGLSALYRNWSASCRSSLEHGRLDSASRTFASSRRLSVEIAPAGSDAEWVRRAGVGRSRRRRARRRPAADLPTPGRRSSLSRATRRAPPAPPRARGRGPVPARRPRTRGTAAADALGAT